MIQQQGKHTKGQLKSPLHFLCTDSLCEASQVAQTGKNLPASFVPWVGKIPWRRDWQPTPVCLPGEFHGQRSLVGYTEHGVTVSQTLLSGEHFHFTLRH